jgi:hypothetical protein
MRYLGRGIAVWGLIACAEVIHGIARGIFLKPRVGDLASRQIGVFTGSALIVAIAWLLIRWIGVRDKRECLVLGAAWLVLMLSFEIGLGRAFGLSWERIASDYNPARGGLMIVGMCVVFAAPLAALALRERG